MAPPNVLQHSQSNVVHQPQPVSQMQQPSQIMPQQIVQPQPVVQQIPAQQQQILLPPQNIIQAQVAPQAPIAVISTIGQVQQIPPPVQSYQQQPSVVQTIPVATDIHKANIVHPTSSMVTSQLTTAVADTVSVSAALNSHQIQQIQPLPQVQPQQTSHVSQQLQQLHPVVSSGTKVEAPPSSAYAEPAASTQPQPQSINVDSAPPLVQQPQQQPQPESQPQQLSTHVQQASGPPPVQLPTHSQPDHVSQERQLVTSPPRRASRTAAAAPPSAPSLQRSSLSVDQLNQLVSSCALHGDFQHPHQYHPQQQRAAPVAGPPARRAVTSTHCAAHKGHHHGQQVPPKRLCDLRRGSLPVVPTFDTNLAALAGSLSDHEERPQKQVRERTSRKTSSPIESLCYFQPYNKRLFIGIDPG